MDVEIGFELEGDIEVAAGGMSGGVITVAVIGRRLGPYGGTAIVELEAECSGLAGLSAGGHRLS